MKCYEKEAGYSGCLKDGHCDTSKGWTCKVKTKVVERPSLGAPGTRLFCFEVMLKDQGTPKKPSHEFALVRTQLSRKASIFGCESYRVFSDVETWLTTAQPPINTIKIEAPHLAKRHNGAWVNSPIFLNVWAYIKANNLHLTCGEGCQGPGAIASQPVDWTVKVDPDTVFLPGRLRSRLASQEVTANGLYITNCHFVKFGFFGNLEVVSRTAMETFLNNMEVCKTQFNWMRKGKEYGEDLYAQKCMALHGVDNVEDFGISDDQVCVAIEKAIKAKACHKGEPCDLLPFTSLPNCLDSTKIAYHPLKDPTDYFACLSNATF
jgi:hypothetical protein